MLILIHIVIACSSILVATVGLVSPSRGLLQLNYAFIVATLLSGIVMVVQTHAPLVSSCLSGLSYLAVVAALSFLAARRLEKSGM